MAQVKGYNGEMGYWLCNAQTIYILGGGGSEMKVKRMKKGERMHGKSDER